jgi:hypothetical protein
MKLFKLTGTPETVSGKKVCLLLLPPFLKKDVGSEIRDEKILGSATLE